MDFGKSIFRFPEQVGLQTNIVGAPLLPLVVYLSHCLSRGKSVRRKPAPLRYERRKTLYMFLMEVKWPNVKQ